MGGRLVVITGATSGIGEQAALQLAERGATVVPVGRDAKRLARVAERLRELGSEAEPVQADLAAQEEVRRLADTLLAHHDRIDVLVNNAGVVSSTRRLSPDGREMTMAINHLAPFLLTNLLLDRLRASAPARVVTTASDAHSSGLLDLEDLDQERKWSIFRAYGTTKLANILFTRELAKRLEHSGVTANCLHPGVIRTRLGRGGIAGVVWKIAGPFMASPKRGGARIVHIAADPIGAEVTGRYFSGDKPRTVHGQAADDALAEGLWERSAALVGLDA